MWGKAFEGQTLTLLIGKYRVQGDSPIGRATKGYFAYVPAQNCLVFLKISWRPLSPDTPSEVERYAQLYAAEVPNVAKLLCGADTYHDPKELADQDGNPVPLRTRNQEWVDNPKLCQRAQIRLVFETLGMPLSEYIDSRAMVKVIYDALKGLYISMTGQTQTYTDNVVSSQTRMGRRRNSSSRHQHRQHND